MVLFAESLDSLVSKDDPARFIDAYVETLGLNDLQIKEKEEGAGRPAYHPKLMLKIYIYGYLNRIRSSRKLMRECMRNVELIWLCEQLTPDYRTISDFRKENPQALKNLFKNFLKYCHQIGLVSLETVGIDGSKMRAQNGASNVYRRESIEAVDRKLDEKIDLYLKEMEQKDQEEQSGEIQLEREKIADRIEALKKAKAKVKDAQTILSKEPETGAVYGHDADCRMMSDKGKIRPGYNVQTAVEGKSKLIVAAEVTNEANDTAQMTPMLEAVGEVKKDLGVACKTDALMDCGYHTEKNILKHQDDPEFDVVAPSPKDSEKTVSPASVPTPAYRAEHFTKADDHYLCPEGKVLSLISPKDGQVASGKRIWVYRCSDCGSCEKRSLCTKDQNGRSITIGAHHDLIEAYRKKMKTETYQKKIRTRKELCEHPFGTLKRNFGYDHFLLRGLTKVRGEFSLMSMVYNLRRALNLVLFDDLVKGLQVVE
jgi:transposase